MRRFMWAAGLILSLLVASLAASAPESPIGAGELNTLLQPHLPHPDPLDGGPPLDRFERSVVVLEGSPPTLISVPGFERYQCGRCHKPEDLTGRAAERLRRVLTRLHDRFPDLPKNPVRQYIVQSYSDSLLSGRQLAHATFDTIRISPATILIDSKVYGESTHLHEILHLTQPFLGHVNELEAYGLNVSDDPQFLLLNYPYFEDVVKLFFVPELGEILNQYFARGVNETLQVPQEVQWFLMGLDSTSLEQLQKAVSGLKPLLQEVSRLYRAQSREVAYWSARTGIRSLLLDIAAVRLLELRALDLPKNRIAQAMAVIDQQMKKDDNTRLGYIIDRKKEALLNLRYGLKISASRERLNLYFHYLKRTFLDEGGGVRLTVPERDRADFENFVRKQVEQVGKMLEYPGLTEIERQGAQTWVGAAQKKLPASPEGMPGE